MLKDRKHKFGGQLDIEFDCSVRIDFQSLMIGAKRNIIS